MRDWHNHESGPNPDYRPHYAPGASDTPDCDVIANCLNIYKSIL